MSQQLLDDFMAGQSPLVWWVPSHGWQRKIEVPFTGLLSGSFNPLHKGHRELMRIAGRQLGGVVVPELTVPNADKPALDVTQIVERCRQFIDQPVAVTHAATFVEKSRLFPGIGFIVGVDTAARIVDPRFYHDDPQQRDAALRTIAQQQCRFRIAARMCDGQLLRLGDVSIPAEHQSLFAEISPEEFRFDISSTDLRDCK